MIMILNSWVSTYCDPVHVSRGIYDKCGLLFPVLFLAYDDSYGASCLILNTAFSEQMGLKGFIPTTSGQELTSVFFLQGS